MGKTGNLKTSFILYMFLPYLGLPVEDGDEEKGEQAVQGEVELNPSDVGDQVGDHREEVWDVGLARDLVL